MDVATTAFAAVLLVLWGTLAWAAFSALGALHSARRRHAGPAGLPRGADATTSSGGQAPAAHADTAVITEPFDASAAASMMVPGDNVVTGNAAYRFAAHTITPIGAAVSLIPATSFAAACVREQFGCANGGATARSLRVDHAPSRFTELRRTSHCEPDGRFRFDAVADGSYYITATTMPCLPIWHAKRVSVVGGQVAIVDLVDAEDREAIVRATDPALAV